MAAKKKAVLASRVNELEAAVSRLFTGVAPPKKKTRRKAKRAKRAKLAVASVKKTAKKAVRKAKRKSKKR